MKAYCFKCQAFRQMKAAVRVTMRNGKAGVRGVCPTCGTKMFRIGRGSEEARTP